MRVTVKFICRNLTSGLISGEYDVPENATIRTIIEECEKQCNVALPEKNLKYLQFMLNGKSALWESSVKDGDELYVLQLIVGG